MFTPGKIIQEFTTKSGRRAVVRYPNWGDIPDLLKHINSVSKENTYITYSGEQETLESEARYMGSEFVGMEIGNTVKLFCYVDGELAGVCDIHRNLAKKKRSAHVGILGLVIGKDFREDGVGFALAKATLEESKVAISGLRIVMLDCFATNEKALALYTKLGFREFGRIPEVLFYKETYVDEVIMALKI